MRVQDIRRAAAMAVVVGAAALAVACADKTLNPQFSRSPLVTLQLSVVGAPSLQSSPAGADDVAVYAVYFNDSGPAGLMGAAAARVVPGASSQSITLRADLATCLADPARTGAHDGCEFRVGALVAPASQINLRPDTNGNGKSGVDPFVYAKDIQWRGPFTASPGKPPTVPAIDLSTSRFAVQGPWTVDEGLRVGGPLTPTQLSGPISGVDDGTTVTLFGLTFGSTVVDANATQNGAQLAVLQNGTWKRVAGPFNPPGNTGQGFNFSDVAALAVNDVYMSGSDGLYHFDGAAITAVSAVREALLSVAVVGSGSGKTIVAGTQSGAVWVGNGTTFTRYAMPQSGSVDGVCVNASNEAFASSQSGGMFRFDGTTWTSVPVPSSSSKADLQCLGAIGQAYVGTQQFPNPLFKWNGAGWTGVPGTGLGSARQYNFGVSSSSEMWAVGDSANFSRSFYRFNGTSWTEVGRGRPRQPLMRRPWASPRGGKAYVASQHGAHIDRLTATSVTLESFQPVPKDMSMTSANNAFVVGTDLLLARWNGTRWNVDATPTIPNRALHGVWTDGPNNAWAVGLSSTILHWDGSKWGAVSTSIAPIAAADNYRAVWGIGGTIWIAGDATMLKCSSTGSCATVSIPGNGPLFSIWGTSASNIYAVGDAGRILHYDGSAWSVMSSPTSLPLYKVWGTGPTHIVAFAENVFLQSDNGVTWKNVALGDGLDGLSTANSPGFLSSSVQLGVWGTGPTELYVGSPFGEIIRGDGVFWTDMISNNLGNPRIVGIGGVAQGCALAVADGLGSGQGPVLLRGVGASGCLGSPMPPPLTWP